MQKLGFWGKALVYAIQAVLIVVIFLPLVFALVSSLRPLEDVYLSLIHI